LVFCFTVSMSLTMLCTEGTLAIGL